MKDADKKLNDSKRGPAAIFEDALEIEVEQEQTCINEDNEIPQQYEVYIQSSVWFLLSSSRLMRRWYLFSRAVRE